MLNLNGVAPVAMQRVLFYVSMPVAIAVLLFSADCAVLWLVRTVKRKLRPVGVVYSRAHIMLLDRFTSCAVIITSIFLPGIAQAAFSMFACLPVDSSFLARYGPAVTGSSSSMYMFSQGLIWVGQCLTGIEGSAAAANLYWIFDISKSALILPQSMGVEFGSVFATADLHHSTSCCDFDISARWTAVTSHTALELFLCIIRQSAQLLGRSSNVPDAAACCY